MAAAEGKGGHTEESDIDESDILTDKLLQSLAISFGSEWSQVALALNINLNQVEQLRNDFRSLKEQATNMLVQWKRRYGRKKDIIETLRSALVECGRRDLADEMDRKISQQRIRHNPQEHSFMDDKELDKQNGNDVTDGTTDFENQFACEGYDVVENMAIIDEDFIETDIFKKAENILRNEQTIWITGKTGSGKTSLAFHLYTLMCEEVDNDMICEEIHDILNELNDCIEKDWVFFADDVFGTLKVDADAVKQYEQLIKNLSKLRKEQDEAGCKTFLIFCTRKDIFEQITIPIPEETIIDISLYQDSIPKSEKRRLFEKVWQKHNNDCDIPSYIAKFDFPNNDHFGFWFCADFHARRCYADGKSFWEDPLVILLKEMKLNMDKKLISPQLCKDMVFHQKHQPLVPRDIDICKNYPEFFKWTKEQCFEFQHLLLHEQIELHLAEQNVPEGISHLSVKSLHKIKVCLPKKGKSRLTKKVRENPLCLTTEWEVCYLLTRLMNEVQNGNVIEVVKHDIWKEDQSALLLDEYIFKKKPSDYIISILTTEDIVFGENISYWSSIFNRTGLFRVLVRYVAPFENSLNCTHYLSRVLIGACAVKKNVSIVKELLVKGADVNFCLSCQSKDRTKERNIPNCENLETHICPLIVAIQNENTNHAITLLRNKACIPHNSWPDWNFLHNVSELQSELLKDPTFLKSLAVIFNSVDQEQESSCSIEKNNFSELLTEIKDSCDDINEIFPVFAKHGFLSLLVLDAFSKSHTNINALDQQKQNVLHLLIQNEHDSVEKFKVIEKLLKEGCDGNQKSKEKDTPLSLAIKRTTNRKPIAEILLAEEKVDPNMIICDGRSPLHICLENTSDEEETVALVKLLLERGCRHVPDKKGYTAIDLVFLENSPGMNLILALCRERPIHSCIESSKLTDEKKCEVIARLMSQKIDINQRDDSNHTPLSKALLTQCSQKVIDCLIKNQADSSLRYGNDQSILQVLFSSNCILGESILTQFMDTDSRLINEERIPVLIDAVNCETSQFTSFKDIIFRSKRDIIFFQDFRDSQNHGLLHLCIMSSMSDDECIDCFNFLQRQSVRRDEKVLYNYTGIMLAAQNHQVCRTKTILRMLNEGYYQSKQFKLKKFLLALLQSGQICSEIIKTIKELISRNSLPQSTAKKLKILHLIAESGGYAKWTCQSANGGETKDSESDSVVGDQSLESPVNLNESGNNNVNTSEEWDQNTVVKHAIVKKPEIESLIESLRACGFDINEKDVLGRTPLFLSCSRDVPDTDLITVFCKNANVNIADNEGLTPLHACVSSNMDDKASKKVCQILVENKAKVNKADKQERTPFLLACEQDIHRSETIKFLLIKCSSDINVRDIKGDSCLHYCIIRNVPDNIACHLIEKLLDYKPNLENKNNLRLTPLNLAATSQTRSRILCMLYLLAKKSDVNTMDFCNRTPLINVLRCLDGKQSATTTALERIVRISLLFAFGANPSLTTNLQKQEVMDNFTMEMVTDYPNIQIEKLVHFITEKLVIISKHHDRTSFDDPFFYDAKDQKRKLYEKVLEASKYLKDAYFKNNAEILERNVEEYGGDNEMQAQVAVTRRYVL